MSIWKLIKTLSRLQITEQGYVKAVLVVDAKGNPRGVVVTEGFETDKFVQREIHGLDPDTSDHVGPLGSGRTADIANHE